MCSIRFFGDLGGRTLPRSTLGFGKRICWQCPDQQGKPGPERPCRCVASQFPGFATFLRQVLCQQALCLLPLPETLEELRFGGSCANPDFDSSILVWRLGQLNPRASRQYPRLVPIWPRLGRAMQMSNAWLFENLKVGLSCKFVLVSTSGPTAGRGWTRSGLDSMWMPKFAPCRGWSA